VNQLRFPHILVFAVALFASDAALATPRAGVTQDISELRIVRALPTVSTMPPHLRRALAHAFEMPRLELANPGTRYKEMASFYYSGDPEAGLPERRLVLAFETPHYYFVYYEAGHPWHAGALAFSKSPRVQLVWGGADLHRPYASSPRQLRMRILRHRLLDDRKYIW
jgi:hypothetical protein